MRRVSRVSADTEEFIHVEAVSLFYHVGENAGEREGGEISEFWGETRTLKKDRNKSKHQNANSVQQKLRL